jgi:hypothetical protein
MRPKGRLVDNHKYQGGDNGKIKPEEILVRITDEQPVSFKRLAARQRQTDTGKKGLPKWMMWTRSA